MSALLGRGAKPFARRSRKRFWGALLGLVAALATIRALSVEAHPVKPYLADKRPIVLAHQGASGHAPSDTMEAFALGLQMGADVLETDLHMTRDGVIVASHDDTIDRMSNGSGKIREMTLAELRRFDFGYDFSPDGGKTFPYRDKGVTIPTLEEIFKRFPDRRVNLEIKQVEPAIEEQVWALVRQYQMQEKVLLASFHSEPVERWRKLAGEQTAIGANRSAMYGFAAFYLTYLDWLWQPSVDAFQLPTSSKLGPVTIRLDTPRLISRAHKLGVKVQYWTINDETTMRRLIELGADGIITDYPDRAVKVLKALGYR